MIAAQNEHFQIVKYLIEQCEADPNIANSDGENALHFAARYNKKDTKVIELLLTNMPLTSINKKTRGGYTPLDCACNYNDSPICHEIVDLIRSKGGKASNYANLVINNNSSNNNRNNLVTTTTTTLTNVSNKTNSETAESKPQKQKYPSEVKLQSWPVLMYL